MIVCNICGNALPGLQTRCGACSGKGIEKPSPVKTLLTPTQRHGSPDRWARSYTTPPGRSTGSPLAKENTVVNTPTPVTPRDGTYLDVQATPGADLARVYGTLIDRSVDHPRCSTCTTTLAPNSNIYIANASDDSTSGDALCRTCYSDRYAKGRCDRCHLQVVGDETGIHKGAHVRGRLGVIWHAECFTCELCDLALYNEDHALSLEGRPHCISCYDRTLDISQAPPSPKPSTPTLNSTQRRSIALTGSAASTRPRFARPGLVISRADTDTPSDGAKQSTRSISKPILSATPARLGKGAINLTENDHHAPARVSLSFDHSTKDPQTDRCRYRHTVRSLALRFEKPEPSSASQPEPLTLSRRQPHPQ